MNSDESLALMQTPIPSYPAVTVTERGLIDRGSVDPCSSASALAPADGCSALAQLALLGAVIGGSAAAGANIRRLQRQEADTAGALADTGRAALATAAATAVAGAAASAVRQQGLLRLGVLFASGTAVMYGIQRYLEGGGES